MPQQQPLSVTVYWLPVEPKQKRYIPERETPHRWSGSVADFPVYILPPILSTYLVNPLVTRLYVYDERFVLNQKSIESYTSVLSSWTISLTQKYSVTTSRRNPLTITTLLWYYVYGMVWNISVDMISFLAVFSKLGKAFGKSIRRNKNAINK